MLIHGGVNNEQVEAGIFTFGTAAAKSTKEEATAPKTPAQRACILLDSNEVVH